MLRVTQQDSSIGAKQYYTQADYLSEGQELIGRWGGKGAHRLGLEGTVGKEAFDRLCDNLHPGDGSKLTVRTRADRTVGYDFTWSVPKSVSLLYAMTEDKQLLDAFRSAVDETMRDIESEMQTRVRRNGKDENRATGNMVWAEFIHKTSRPVEGIPDPQLHAHAFCLNVTWDEKEQRWKAGQFRDLKRDAPYFQAAMRVRLANKLQDLGFGIVRKRDDFEIAGVPAAVIRKFSRRTEEIERTAAERGITDPDRKAELGAATRERKNNELTWNELRREWDSRLTNAERQACIAAYRRKTPYAREASLEKLAVDHAIDHCFVHEPVVAERKLVTEALKRGLGGVTLEGVQAELASRPLIRGEHGGRASATTEELRQADDRVVSFGREGRGRLHAVGDADRPCTREWLNAEQQAAVRHVLGSRDRVTIIRGVAGTGKTTLERELGEALAEAGAPMAAIAQSTTAVDELRHEAGFASAATIAHFVRDKKMQASIAGGLLLVDEASLIGSKDMLRLFDIVREQGARIALVGDIRQHRSVNAGEPLRLLEERAGLKVAEVTQIVRQSGDYRKVAEALSEGRTAEGLAQLDGLGWVREIDHAGRYFLLAQGYLSATLEKKKDGKQKTALCVSPTHVEGARVTGFIRNALKQDGKLGEEHTLPAWIPAHLTDTQKADATELETGSLLQFHQNAPGFKNGSRLVIGEDTKPPVEYADRFEVYRPSQLALAEGDRVRITRNGHTKDGKHALKNGTLYTVQGFTKQSDPILDNGWVVAKDFGHIAHGYCVTSQAAEGKTVDKVFIGISSQSYGANNQRSISVPVTRGREQAVLFTDNKAELLKAAERPDQPLSAIEFAEKVRARPSLRMRLKKHLSQLRRRWGFERTHEKPARVIEQAQSLQREMGHER
jgi:conjugative relaxase-like TrwC/TraI family protein